MLFVQLENFATVLEALANNFHGIVGELDFEALLSVGVRVARVVC